MIIEQIRAETSVAHKELDQWLSPVFSSIKTNEAYAKVLKSFYGYFDAVMQKVDTYVTAQHLADKNERRKTSAILNDLAAIESSYEDNFTASNIPQINSLEEAIGAYYVLEGSTMGGVFLSKMIRDNFGWEDNSATQFFYGYGKESKEKWAKFIEALNKVGDESHCPEKIIATANDTFSLFKKHLERHL